MRVHASPKLEESTLRIRAHTHTHTMCTKDAFSSSGWCIQSPRGSWLRQLQLFSPSPSRPAWGSARCPPAFLSLPDPPRSLKMGQTEEVKCRGNKSRVKWNLLKTKKPQNRNIYKRNSLPLCQTGSQMNRRTRTSPGGTDTPMQADHILLELHGDLERLVTFSCRRTLHLRLLIFWGPCFIVGGFTASGQEVWVLSLVWEVRKYGGNARISWKSWKHGAFA